MITAPPALLGNLINSAMAIIDSIPASLKAVDRLEDEIRNGPQASPQTLSLRLRVPFAAFYFDTPDNPACLLINKASAAVEHTPAGGSNAHIAFDSMELLFAPLEEVFSPSAAELPRSLLLGNLSLDVNHGPLPKSSWSFSLPQLHVELSLIQISSLTQFTALFLAPEGSHDELNHLNFSNMFLCLTVTSILVKSAVESVKQSILEGSIADVAVSLICSGSLSHVLELQKCPQEQR